METKDWRGALSARSAFLGSIVPAAPDTSQNFKCLTPAVATSVSSGEKRTESTAHGPHLPTERGERLRQSHTHSEWSPSMPTLATRVPSDEKEMHATPLWCTPHRPTSRSRLSVSHTSTFASLPCSPEATSTPPGCIAMHDTAQPCPAKARCRMLTGSSTTPREAAAHTTLPLEVSKSASLTPSLDTPNTWSTSIGPSGASPLPAGLRPRDWLPLASVQSEGALMPASQGSTSRTSSLGTGSLLGSSPAVAARRLETLPAGIASKGGSLSPVSPS
mmetsp:Transcript_14822/g.37696  ORF Transcript_14822/g.37696 Transcript_14822/m.37696 type:complete len:275 (-) Transcript_14822:43-867(-)